MFDFFGKTVAKIFGTKSDRDIKGVMPYVGLINQEFAKLATLSDDQLRNRTQEVQAAIADRLKPIDDKISALHQRIEDETELDIAQKEEIFVEIDQLEKDRNKDLEVAEQPLN